MSVDDNQIINVVDGDDGVGAHDGNEKKIVNKGFGSRAKKVVLLPFTKAKSRRKNNNTRFSSSPSSSLCSCFVARRNDFELYKRGYIKGCCCFADPKTLDSPVESYTRDPNSPKFSFGSLKALIEKNDFYSNDCNPHLDVDHLSSCNHLQ